MKTAIKKMLMKSNIGKAIWNYLRIKKGAFQSASIESFLYLDKWYRKKTIHSVYEKAFRDIFILLRHFNLNGDVFEFGTYQGYTAMLLAKNMHLFRLNNTSLHLFDSFEGFPEAKDLDTHSYEFHSGAWVKGSVAAPHGIEKVLHKKLAKILGVNRLHITKGFFEDSLTKYFEQIQSPKASLVHIDCDLYSSSKYVLDFLLKNEIIQDGTILIFDDWMTSLGNPNLGQRKATREILEKYPTWMLEQYCNYGVGSHVFIAHDLRITHAKTTGSPLIVSEK